MLTTAQVEHYHTEGYVAVPGFLSAEEGCSLPGARWTPVSVGQYARQPRTSPRMEMEPNQPPDGAQVRRLYEPCSPLRGLPGILRIGSPPRRGRGSARPELGLPLQQDQHETGLASARLSSGTKTFPTTR